MFDEILGKYICSDYTTGLKEDEKPFSILWNHELTLKKEEVDSVIRIGV